MPALEFEADHLVVFCILSGHEGAEQKKRGGKLFSFIVHLLHPNFREQREMMDQDLGKAFSALRLVQKDGGIRNGRTVSSNNPFPNYSTTAAPSSYGHYSTSAAQPQYLGRPTRYPIPTESVYANVDELRYGQVKSHYPEPQVPPTQRHPESLVQIAHVPTQSKVSLEEAMRYTPPDQQPRLEDNPVYENIGLYSSPPIKPEMHSTTAWTLRNQSEGI